LALVITSSHGLATSLPAQPEPPDRTKKQFLPFRARESLHGLLRRHGFSEKQILMISRQNILPKGISLAHGESYRERHTADRRYSEVKIYEATRNLAYIFWRHEDAAGSLVREENFKLKERTIKGRVNGSLLSSITNKLPVEWAAHRFMDAYSFDYNVPRQLKKNAGFSFRIETKWDGPDLVGYGEILETALEIGGGIERRYFVRYPGGGTFLNPGNTHLERPLFAPVGYMRLSSLFESRRFHPIKHRRQPHQGVDFELPEGTDIFAAEAGTVLRSGRQRASGNFVVIRHHNGLETYYNHMRLIADNIFPGAQVENGQKVGEIGCTGYCTKAHLHFAVKRLGGYVDPMKFLKAYPFRSQGIIGKHQQD
jgi:murein DD-endopeptidase MepM/ murein hydrolase activator NlpD